MIIGFNAEMSQWPQAFERWCKWTSSPFSLSTVQPNQWVERQKEEGEYNPLWEREENFGRQADWLSRQRVVNKEVG